MTDSRNPDRLVRAFLSEGVEELSDNVYDSVRDQLHHNRQRVVIGPLRMPIMNSNAVRLGIAAAAVVLVAFLGIKFLPWSSIGDPTATPTATSSGSPFPVDFEVTIPRGWRLATIDEGHISLSGTQASTGHPVRLQFFTVGRLIDDPCHPAVTPPSDTPPTAREILEGLANLPYLVVGGPSETTIGGRPATRLEVAVRTYTGTTGCDHALPLFETPTGEQPATNRPTDPINWDLVLWIVDVEPRPMVVVADLHPPDLTARMYNEFVADLVASLRFE